MKTLNGEFMKTNLFQLATMILPITNSRFKVADLHLFNPLFNYLKE